MCVWGGGGLPYPPSKFVQSVYMKKSSLCQQGDLRLHSSASEEKLSHLSNRVKLETLDFTGYPYTEFIKMTAT